MFNVSTCCGIILALVLPLWENRACAGSLLWQELGQDGGLAGNKVPDGTVAGLRALRARGGLYQELPGRSSR